MHAVKPLARYFSDDLLLKIPVIGRLPVVLPNGKRIYMYSEGYDYTAPLAYFRGIYGYESGTMRLFYRLLPHAATLFDIGANTGIYSLVAAAENPARRISSFEPVPRIFSALERNVRESDLPNCRLFRCAVTDYTGEIPLHIPPGRIPFGATTDANQGRSLETISVPATTIDAFIAAHGIGGLDLLKVDTEATEPAVLRGASQALRRFRPIIICEVLPGKTESQLHAILDSLHYAYYWITSSALKENASIRGDAQDMNWLFIPREKTAVVLDRVSITRS